MDELPGYSELPGWVWLPPTLLGLAVVTAAVLVVLASLRCSGLGRILVLVLGASVLAVLGWWALSPATVAFGGNDVTCGVATRTAFLRGNPNDSTLNQADRACRTQSRKEATGQALTAAVVVACAVVVRRRCASSARAR